MTMSFYGQNSGVNQNVQWDHEENEVIIFKYIFVKFVVVQKGWRQFSRLKNKKKSW